MGAKGCTGHLDLFPGFIPPGLAHVQIHRGRSALLTPEAKGRPLLTREELQLLLRTDGEQSDMKPMEKDMIHRISAFPLPR